MFVCSPCSGWLVQFKGCSNEKVRNDTVGINEDFIQSIHHRPKHNNPIDERDEEFLVSRIPMTMTRPSPSQPP